MTNRELLERIIGDLNELIDKRGNTQFIPVLVEIKKAHEEVLDQERLIRAIRRIDPICYMGHTDCYDTHSAERRADEADWEEEREKGL